ncbi:MAG: AMP-binding protein [Pseudomonadota bacterium]|nr:AMP-binding protein [Pseudomonadota bacterium]
MKTFLPLPSSREEILKIQSARKRVAFERAKRADWYKGKLEHIDAARLDDPAVWQQIPIVDKDILRQLDHADFMGQFCIAPKEQIAEYWRSGGTTGKPVFYPRTFEDVDYGLVTWGRSFPAMDIGPEDLCHISFPIGVHPAGQIWARSAHMFGVGMAWVGAGNSVPSAVQLELIQTLEPTVLIAMPSFALHLANLAAEQAVDLTQCSVKKIICSAEPLSDAKRAKLARTWGAEVFNVFGMSEAGLMGAEGSAHDGMHIWSDMFFIEVIDPATGEILPEGEEGNLCQTPLWTGNATPFLRWNAGDIVRYVERGKSDGPFADLFPMIQHANRTTGFFKIRGVNINHAEFEDFIFATPPINDFQAVLVTDDSDLETLNIRIEVKRDEDSSVVAADLEYRVKATFEITPRIEVLKVGTLARLFETSIKAPRFVDERN